jgi:hypothetical protein
LYQRREESGRRGKENYLETVYKHLLSGMIGLTTAFEIDMKRALRQRPRIPLPWLCGYLWLYSKTYYATLCGSQPLCSKGSLQESWRVQQLYP